MIFSFPAFYVFGANTDVGKTLVSAGLLQAATRAHKAGFYLKPLQTGPEHTWDSAFVAKMCGHSVASRVLYSWRQATSPHTAARAENFFVSDENLMESVAKELERVANELQSNPQRAPFVLVEGAGGVASPTATGALQCDVFRNIRLPVVLVGDGRLGGISSTVCAAESLLMRGFELAAIVVLEQGLENAEALNNAFGGQFPVWSIPALSALKSDQNEKASEETVENWYDTNLNFFDACYLKLEGFHQQRLQRLNTLPEIAKQNIWWPTTQHKGLSAPTVIDSARSDFFECVAVEQGSNTEAKSQSAGLLSHRLFDGTASWWTQCLPHGDVTQARNIAAALGRYGHVLFPKNIHEPAARLSELLLAGVGSGWAQKVFYSDNGSTATEAALKMAFRAAKIWQNIPVGAHISVLGLQNSYHGDTLGAMDATSPSVYNGTTPWYAPRGVWFEVPQVICAHQVVSVQLPASFTSALSDAGIEVHMRVKNIEHLFSQTRESGSLAELYTEVICEKLDLAKQENVFFGALLIEPIVQGAGGMIFVDPLFQKILVKEARARSIPIVFDEVFTGFWRLGAQSGAQLLGISPDIACYSKTLSGGVVPLAATLASSAVFDVFLSDKKVDALLHGHSFTAYPAGCAAAVTALEILQKKYGQKPDFVFNSLWNQAQVQEFSGTAGVRRAYVLGTLLVVELEDAAAGYESTAGAELTGLLAEAGLYVRPMGNVFYLLAQGFSRSEDLQKVLNVFLQRIAISLKKSEAQN